MIKHSFLIALAMIAGQIVAGQQHLISAMSTVTFKIKNLGFTVDGSFSGLKGVVRFNRSRPGEASIEASVESKTVHTGIGARDRHLRNEDYLFVEKFPAISFVSEKITEGSNGEFIISGTLTLKGKTKFISFPFTARDEKDGTRFLGSFTINRRDFNVGGASFSLSDNLTVYLSVFAD